MGESEREASAVKEDAIDQEAKQTLHNTDYMFAMCVCVCMCVCVTKVHSLNLMDLKM